MESLVQVVRVQQVLQFIQQETYLLTYKLEIYFTLIILWFHPGLVMTYGMYLGPLIGNVPTYSIQISGIGEVLDIVDCSTTTTTTTTTSTTTTTTIPGIQHEVNTTQDAGSLTSGDACSSITTGNIYSNRANVESIIVGDILYSNDLLTNAWNGGNGSTGKWYGLSNTAGQSEYAMRIDIAGEVKEIVDCSSTTTTTTTTVATTAYNDIGYDASDGNTACSNYPSGNVFYGDNATWLNVGTIYTNASGTNFAPPGFYSDGTYVHEVVNQGSVIQTALCGGVLMSDCGCGRKKKSKDMRFVCAQPGTSYYAWQVEVMLNNFKEVGINLNQVDIVCYIEDEIPEQWHKLRYGYAARFFFYKDTRLKKQYISSIRPNILKQHWEQYPELQNDVIFYHDCDIVFTKPIDWNQFTNDELWYGSDTKWYISYDYIIGKGEDVFESMTNIIDIDPQIVIDNNDNTIGAQYIMKNIDASFLGRCRKR